MKIKALLYCTKQPHKLYATDKGYVIADCELGDYYSKKEKLNGMIVAECDFEVDKLTNCGSSFRIMKYDDLQENYRYTNKVARDSCLDYIDLRKYLGTKDGYAIHIKNLKERVMELSNVYKYDNSYDNMLGWIEEESEKYIPLDKAPQNMMRVWLFENSEWVMYILISIQSQWMCLILNRIKDVEVRKVVLKEMIN